MEFYLVNLAKGSKEIASKFRKARTLENINVCSNSYINHANVRSPKQTQITNVGSTTPSCLDDHNFAHQHNFGNKNGNSFCGV
jgi:hypothetical protein